MRGGSRPGAGRPKGAATKKTREVAVRAAKEGVTPLEYMLQLLRDPNTPPDRRDWAAEKAAPYIHARLAAVQHSGNEDAPIVHEVRWSDE